VFHIIFSVFILYKHLVFGHKFTYSLSNHFFSATLTLHLYPKLPGGKPVPVGVKAKRTMLFHNQVTHERISVPTIKSI
jgi:hypothetical protein